MKIIKKIMPFVYIFVILIQSTATTAFAAEQVQVFNSDLLSTSETGITVSGYTLADTWAAERCGFTANSRKVLCNTANSGNPDGNYLVFDMGDGKVANKASFNVTVRDDYQSGITADGALNSMLYGSNTGEDGTWVAITDGVHNDEPLDKIADGTRHFYTYTLTWDNIENYRYLKFDPSEVATWTLYIHKAEIFGIVEGSDVTSEIVVNHDCETKTIAENPYFTSEVSEGMRHEKWTGNGIPEGHTYFFYPPNPETNPSHIIYTAKSGEYDVVYVDLFMNVRFENEDPKVYVSRNNVIWTQVTNVKKLVNAAAEGTADLNKRHIRYILSDDLKNMKNIKIVLDGIQYRLYDINIGISKTDYSYDLVSYAEAPQAVFADNKWTVSGKLNCGASDVSEALIMLGVYKDGQMIDLTRKVQPLSIDENSFTIESSILSDTATEVILYVWKDEDSMVPIITTPAILK